MVSILWEWRYYIILHSRDNTNSDMQTWMGNGRQWNLCIKQSTPLSHSQSASQPASTTIVEANYTICVAHLWERDILKEKTPKDYSQYTTMLHHGSDEESLLSAPRKLFICFTPSFQWSIYGLSSFPQSFQRTNLVIYFEQIK